ncbi:hypothetical protein [Actinomadura terrae]|uniref:hypothetical protein n=1 Tax=Actinomadura terrae TaxID=604353 RepID=UPI001FA7B88A|nr:hypothetical protein [Actinomadura terrae]
MDEEADESGERWALGALCDDLPALRDHCTDEPEQRLLSRIEAEARARRPIRALLADLIGGDPSGTTRGPGSGLPGGGPGRADEEVFGCPDGACDRTAPGVPAGPFPRCGITGLLMAPR